MLDAAGIDVDPADALRDGRAMDVWRRMIAAQGGDPSAPLPTARETQVVAAPASGVLTRLDALAVGIAAWRLGAGRARKEDPVSPAPASSCSPSPATPCGTGEPLLELHTDDPALFERAVEALEGGIEVGELHEPAPLVLDPHRSEAWAVATPDPRTGGRALSIT